MMNPMAVSICKALDVDRALAVVDYRPPGGVKDNGERADTRETVLAALHKVRVRYWKHFTAREREQSKTWLLDNGWKLPQ